MFEDPHLYREYLSSLDIPELAETCRINKETYEICTHSDFWKQKYLKEGLIFFENEDPLLKDDPLLNDFNNYVREYKIAQLVALRSSQLLEKIEESLFYVNCHDPRDFYRFFENPDDICLLYQLTKNSLLEILSVNDITHNSYVLVPIIKLEYLSENKYSLKIYSENRIEQIRLFIETFLTRSQMSYLLSLLLHKNYAVRPQEVPRPTLPPNAFERKISSPSKIVSNPELFNKWKQIFKESGLILFLEQPTEERYQLELETSKKFKELVDSIYNEAYQVISFEDPVTINEIERIYRRHAENYAPLENLRFGSESYSPLRTKFNRLSVIITQTSFFIDPWTGTAIDPDHSKLKRMMQNALYQQLLNPEDDLYIRTSLDVYTIPFHDYQMKLNLQYPVDVDRYFPTWNFIVPYSSFYCLLATCLYFGLQVDIYPDDTFALDVFRIKSREPEFI